MKEEENNIQSGEESTGELFTESGKEKGSEILKQIDNDIAEYMKVLTSQPVGFSPNPKKITSQQIHQLANPKKLVSSSKLKSSPPPLTPEMIAPEMEKQKEAIEYFDKFKDLPINWPYCSISKCAEPAHWGVQQKMDDPKSPIGFLCSKCFTLLPYAPLDPYRVFKLSINNYQRLIQLSIDLGGATSLVKMEEGRNESSF